MGMTYSEANGIITALKAMTVGDRVWVCGREYIKSHYTHPHYVDLQSGVASTGNELVGMMGVTDIVTLRIVKRVK